MNEGFTITGTAQINMFQMITQQHALMLEIKGIKHSRGSVYAHIKRTYGLKGSRQKVLEQFTALIKKTQAEEASDEN